VGTVNELVLHYIRIHSCSFLSLYSNKGFCGECRYVKVQSIFRVISGPSPGTRIRLLPLTRAQSRVVTGPFTGHSTLRRHLHLMGLTDSPLCRKCGAEDETSAHILCWCEALASTMQAQLGSFLEPEDIKSQTLGAIWRFSKAAGLP
jgi:hypothetical protein